MNKACASEGKHLIWNFTKFVETTIERPAHVVWPYLFREKVDVWTRTPYTTVAGEAGKVGEIYEMSFEGGTFAFETIAATPEKRLVLKILYQQGAESERKLSGYDFFALHEVAGRTTVTFNQAVELLVDLKEDLSSRTETHGKFLTDIFQDLKRMVEGSPLGESPATWWRS